MELSKDERIHFENLSKDRQSVFLEAFERDQAKLDGEFVFSVEDRRIKAVLYNGVYYWLNVIKH